MDWIKEKMHQARLRRIQIQNQGEFAIPAHEPQKNTKSGINSPAQTYDVSQTLVLLAAGLVAGAIIVIFIWSANLIDVDSGPAVDRFQNKASVQAQHPVEQQTGYTNTESKSGELGDEIPTDTVSRLELLPSPAAGKAGTLADTETVNSGAATTREVHTISMPPTADAGIPVPESKRDSGKWVINLVSLRQKVDAERFALQANSKGVAVEKTQVTVRGKKYWRVQVTGFSSAEEATTKAGEVKNKLGLKDIWVVQR